MINEIAEKIGSLRRLRGLTLKELGDKCGLSISFLSQIENGSSSLAITSLKKIADALEVPVTFFFASQENRNYHVELAQQKPFRIEGSNGVYTRLSGCFSDRLLEAMLVVIKPGMDTGQRFSHPGEELIYVLEGVIVVEIENKRHLVKAGESIHYPSTIAHFWTNPLKEDSRVLCVLTPAPL